MEVNAEVHAVDLRYKSHRENLVAVLLYKEEQVDREVQAVLVDRLVLHAVNLAYKEVLVVHRAQFLQDSNLEDLRVKVALLAADRPVPAKPATIYSVILFNRTGLDEQAQQSTQ